MNQIVDENISIDRLIKSPFDTIAEQGIHLHPALPLPRDLYGKGRLNSQGVDFSNENVLQNLQEKLNQASSEDFHAASIVNGEARNVGEAQPVRNPADHNDVVGTVSFADAALAQEAIGAAVAALPEWSAKPASERADCLRRFADLLEQHTPALMMLAVREAGKTLNNAVAEVREAVDFCRYYANEAENTLPKDAKAVGAIVAISPWNFPLAIFTGEVVAALAAGNTVIAKPAEQTSLIATYAVSLMHQAGIPTSALQLVLGAGDVGSALTGDTRIGGVIFTGSTEVARLINKALSKRDDNPVLIAETGGQNAMIVDSTALPEQVCLDVLNSAFDSAGQRCSALRILCVQEDVADKMVNIIKGAMDELVVGKPTQLTTDIGPVIDAEAQQNLLAHINRMKGVAKAYHEIKTAADVDSNNSTFVRPILFELNNLNELQREVFGPVLHVVRYRASELDQLIDQINAKGYALTSGVHSRIEGTVEHVRDRIEAGNIYVNRNIVGAVVGVQPFGGHGLSGTGPKAGGPFYLQRLVRTPEWVAPTLSRIGQADEDALKRLETLVHKLPFNAEEKKTAAAALGHARVRTLRKAETVLVGPTGERNSLSWRSPKHVWVHGGTLLQAFSALTELAAAGIQTVVEPNSPLVAYSADLDGLLQVNSKPENAGISHVAAIEPLSSERKQELAGHDGALIRILPSEQGLDILQVFEEISCSINTTAAGGNASLMAVAD